MDRYRLMLAILVTCCLCSCASTMIADHDLIIDKIPSKDMHIDYIYVDYDNGSTEISGTVRFNFRMIGTPSDHLVVTIIDRSGKEFYSASSDYYRIGKPNRQLDIFRFSLTIPDTIPDSSTIRLENVESS